MEHLPFLSSFPVLSSERGFCLAALVSVYLTRQMRVNKDGSSEEAYNVTPQAFFVENPGTPSRKSLP